MKNTKEDDERTELLTWLGQFDILSLFIYLLAWHKWCIFGGSPNLRHRSLKARVEVLFWARVPTTQACTQVIRYQCFCLVEISISIIGIALVPPGDFVTNVNVKQINSQSELTSMSSFAGPSYLTVRSSLYIILHHLIVKSLHFQSLPNSIQLPTSETSPVCASFQRTNNKNTLPSVIGLY